MLSFNEAGQPEPKRALSDLSGSFSLDRSLSSLVEVDLAAQSHPGSRRQNNQDHYLAVRVERAMHQVLSNLPEGLLPHCADETAYGMCVADGVGGMPAGELASSLALRKLIDLVIKTPDWILRMNRRKAAIVRRRMTERFRRIDAALREYGDRDPKLTGMGTTLTAACSLGPDLFVGHIGDSRAYLLHDGEFRQLTRDHTLAQAMLEAGAALQDDAVRQMRRVLTAALGSTARPTDPQVQRFHLADGDQLLLCTDGLTEAVDPAAICFVLQNAPSADEACRGLIDAALSSGAADNVTVVLARYRFPQSL